MNAYEARAAPARFMEWGACPLEGPAMCTQRVALVNGTPDIVASLESLFEGGRYEVVFPGLQANAYAEIRRLRPQRVVLCTTLEDYQALQLLTMLRLDPATRGIPVVAVTPHGECDFGDGDGVPATRSPRHAG
jgi:CheY-like chemotaxis protein